MSDYITLVDTNQYVTSQCYYTSKSPYILDWIKAYMNNNGIDMILQNVQKSKNMKRTADDDGGVLYMAMHEMHPGVR